MLSKIHRGNKMEDSSKNIKTLIVDDDSMQVELVIDVLTDFPLTIFRASNGSEALKIYKRETPILIITDFEMPVMNGIELIREIRKVGNPLKTFIITLSGSNLEENVVNGLKAGANDFIAKPFSVREFSTKVENAIKVLRQYNDLILDREKLIQSHLLDKETGIYNTNYLSRRYKEEMAKAHRYKRNIAGIKLSVSASPEISPNKGISEYNNFMTYCLNIISEVIRKCDIVIRTDLKEFTILLPETTKDNAVVAAKKLLSGLQDSVYIQNNKKFKVFANIGVADNNNQTSEVNGLLHFVDEAFLKASLLKSGGLVISDD